jgi:hypothetical protein
VSSPHDRDSSKRTGAVAGAAASAEAAAVELRRGSAADVRFVRFPVSRSVTLRSVSNMQSVLRRDDGGCVGTCALRAVERDDSGTNDVDASIGLASLASIPARVLSVPDGPIGGSSSHNALVSPSTATLAGSASSCDVCRCGEDSN